MKIQTTAINQTPTITKEILQQANQQPTTLNILQEDTVTFKNANGEEVTYNLKPNENQKASATDIKRDMSHLGQKHSPIKAAITLFMDTGEYQFGEFNSKAKIDEYFTMTDRLGIEQQDKMQYMKPSQDWLDIADKLSDKELNEFVDLMYSISESVHFERRNSDEVELTISKFNKLTSGELGSAIKTMTQLNTQANDYKKPTDTYNNWGITTGAGSIFTGTLIGDAGGDILRDYSKLMFDSALSKTELNTVNEHLSDMDLSAAKGLISSVTLMKGEPKMQLFSLLSESDSNELSAVFSYINDLINKPYNATQYDIEFSDNTKRLATVVDPALSETEQTYAIENILAVESKNGLMNTTELTKKVNTGTSQAQIKIWDTLAEESEGSSNALTNKNVNALLQSVTEKIELKHRQQLQNSFPLYVEAYGQIKTINKALS
ncbi:hypothetical protein [Pseudocolwellia agarivorans]|uniref:hypothetical protein n=1 Tax=Pseudocolwellia agarivorans TaxID=1911682 RepID=UPI0009851060|nr:hypothetical protein [Pseudocolwellia agarivorans]